MAKIIDCSIGFNEVDLFRLRVEELKNVVDAFVIVEALRTHSGMGKPILFGDAAQEYARRGLQVVHFVIDDMPGLFNDTLENRFTLEIFQRNCIMRPLSVMGLDKNDIVLVSDVDEIPRATAVASVSELLGTHEVVIFEQWIRRFFVNNVSDVQFGNNVPWFGTVACKYEPLRRILPQGARIGDPFCPRSACLSWGYARELYPYEARIFGAGWHFTSMGGIAAIRLKMETVSEGGLAPRHDNVDPTPSRHNWSSYRREFRTELNNFISTYCPHLASLNVDDREKLTSLNLPAWLVDAARDFETLFYFADTLDHSNVAQESVQ